MPTFLTGSTVPIDVTEMTSSITGLLGQYFTFQNVATIIGAGLTLTAGLAIGWFGARWLIGKVAGAFKKGRL